MPPSMIPDAGSSNDRTQDDTRSLNNTDNGGLSALETQFLIVGVLAALCLILAIINWLLQYCSANKIDWRSWIFKQENVGDQYVVPSVSYTVHKQRHYNRSHQTQGQQAPPRSTKLLFAPR